MRRCNEKEKFTAYILNADMGDVMRERGAVVDGQLLKGAHPKKKYLRIKRLGLSVLLVLFFEILTFSTASAEAAGPSATGFYEGNPGTMVVERLTVKDGNGNPIGIGQEEDFTLSVSDILAGLNTGEAGAFQSALFATQADGQQGIVKNIVDVAADPVTGAIDLVIVLDVSGSMSETLPGGDLSPIQDTRLAVAQQAIIQLSESVLSEGGNNRISVITFSTGVDGALPFTSDREAVNGFIAGLSTGDYTNYESGLNQAEAFLTGRTEAEAERKSYVILITDGQPNQGDALSGAGRLKDNTNAELYCIGIQSGASDLLSALATDDSHFKDCATADEFMDYVNEVKQQSSAVQSAIFSSEIGSGFTLLCSEAYPITIGEAVYPSIDHVPSDLMRFTAEQGRIQWNIAAADRSGVRFSYYTLLTDEARAAFSHCPMIPVNSAGNLEYRPHYKESDGTVTTADEPVFTALPAYTVSAESSVLTVTISSDKMKHGDAPAGRPLQYADKIKYTVRLENAGQLTAENIVIGATIPGGTNYVSGINATPDYDTQLVSSQPLSLLPGAAEEISFVVRVYIREGTIANAGFLHPALQGYAATERIKTRELTNPVMTNDSEYEPPEPAPPIPPSSLPPESPAVSPPKNPGGGSLIFTVKINGTAEASPFSLVVELSDDLITGQYGDVFFVNGKAELVLSHGETKTVKHLAAGVTYTAQISSSLPYTFKVGETDTAIASGTIAGDTAHEVVFSAYRSGEDAAKEEAAGPGTTVPVPPGTPPADQSALDKAPEVSATGSSDRGPLFVIAGLCLVLTMQILDIRSDLCVLKWYGTKKAEFLNQR